MIRFLCPTCGKNLKAPDDLVGRAAKCSRCGASVEIPLSGLIEAASPAHAEAIAVPQAVEPDMTLRLVEPPREERPASWIMKPPIVAELVPKAKPRPPAQEPETRWIDTQSGRILILAIALSVAFLLVSFFCFVSGNFGVAMLCLVGGGLCTYLIPALVADARSHPNATPIFVVNLLLGWSLVGWTFALAWSLSAIKRT